MSFLPLDFTLANLNDGSDCDMDALDSMENDLPIFSQESDSDNYLSSHDEVSKSPFLVADESIDLCDGGISIPDCPLQAIDPSPSRSPFVNQADSNKENVDMQMSPITPKKPTDLANDPLTPTANLKVLISAASPEIRNRDNKKKELFQQEAFETASTCTETEEWQENQPNRIEFEIELGGTRCDPPTSRKEKSLGLLCLKFLDLFPEYPSPDSDNIELSLDEVAKELGVERRRIYDIVNVLESVELVSRIAKNKYAWHGKRNLPHTLARLQALGEAEGYADKIKGVKDFELASGMNDFEKIEKKTLKTKTKRKPLSSLDNLGSAQRGDADTQSCMALMAAKAMLRKDKSLGIMSQKFLMLFLVSQPRVVNLELAAKILIGDPNIDKTENAKFKTKIRRLYDIANILTSLNLIQKVHVSDLRGRKPAFKYIGPIMEHVPESETACSADGTYRPSTKHSMLDCIQNPNACGVDVRDSTEETNSSPEVMVKSEKRVGALKQEARNSNVKKRFSRHGSFDLICQAAAEERTKLYSSLPPSPVPSHTEDSPTRHPNGVPPTQVVHTIMPPASAKKPTTFLVIRSDQVKQANATKKSGQDLILKLANRSGANAKQPTVVSLTKDEINAVLNSLNVNTPCCSAGSKYVDASTQFSPQQTTMPALRQTVQTATVGAVPTHIESVKRTLEVDYPDDSPLELTKKARVEMPVTENVVIEAVNSPTVLVRSPDVEVSCSGDNEPMAESFVKEEVSVPHSEEELPATVSPAIVVVSATVTDASLSVSSEDVAVHRAILRISPEFTDSSNSQDAEVARINMPVLERAKLISKGRPSPLRVLHLEPEFCASPSMPQLPRLPSNSPSPQLPHRVTEKDLDLASPLLVPHKVKEESPTVNGSYNFPVITEEMPVEIEGPKVTIPAIPRSLYNDIVMPQPLSPSNFSMSPREGQSNSVFCFPSSAVNTPDFELQRLAQANRPSPAIMEERSTLVAPGLAQVPPMFPFIAMTPKTILPSTIQHQYSTPIQNLALANSMKMTFHSNITNTMTPTQSIGTSLAFTPISSIATPGTFFRSTPGAMFPMRMKATPSDMLSDGISATLLPSGGYLLPFKKDFIPVRKLSMPPKDDSMS